MVTEYWLEADRRFVTNMNTSARRRVNSQGDAPDLTKLEISAASDGQHDKGEDLTTSEDDDCDKIDQLDELDELTIPQGPDSAPVLTDTESSLKRYFPEQRSLITDRLLMNNLLHAYSHHLYRLTISCLVDISRKDVRDILLVEI